MKFLAFSLFVLGFVSAGAHSPIDADRKIYFPDIPGYFVLKCDLHMHTVFSDGDVWPSVRVEEAQRDGLDAIAITDHLEELDHGEDIPAPDRNRSFDIAKKTAEGSDLIVINGTEITRDLPPGHANAVFISDSNQINVEDPIDAYRAANVQGGFVFWNHPMWIGQDEDGVAELADVHRELIADGLMQGIEVVNEDTYSEEALQIALDNDLTIIGVSDIHGLIDWQYKVPEGGHRPLTLVLASNRSEAGIRQALVARRSAALIDDTLIGRPAHVMPIVEASLVSVGAEYLRQSSVALVTLRNDSSIHFTLENTGDYDFHSHADVVRLPGRTETKIQVKTLERKAEFDLKFKALNVITAPDQHPEFTISVSVE